MKKKIVEDLKLLTPQDVCEIFKIKIRTFYFWVKQKKFPVIKMGKCIRIEKQAIQDFIQKLKANS